MANVVLMPKVGISVESCIITEWVKQVGDKVAAGDILFSYETDKSSMECESTEEGVLIEQFFADGDEVPVLVAVCAIGTAGEDVSALRPNGASAPNAPASQEKPAETPAEIAMPPVANAAQEPVKTEGDIKISPRAKRLAAKQNVDVSYALPTGPYGRVIERDVRSLIEQGVGVMTSAAYASGISAASGTGIGGRVATQNLATAHSTATQITTVASPNEGVPEFEDVKFTGIRKAISKNMSASLANIPQLTHNFSFDATQIMAYRAMIKNQGETMGLPSITLNDFILYAVSRILPKYPELNAHMLDSVNLRKFRNVNLGMAVDTPRGLMVPVIKNANLKTLAQIANEAKLLARKAQEGSISPDDMGEGTFTISNLGVFGVESFTPVINPPQTGILGVDNIVKRPREINGEIKLYPAMGVSLTYDHRAIDGAPASRFAMEVCRALESFTLLLAQ